MYCLNQMNWAHELYERVMFEELGELDGFDKLGELC